MTTPADEPQAPVWIDAGLRRSARRVAEPDTAGLPVPGPPNEPEADPDTDLFERDWDKPKHTNRLTVTLLAGLVAVAGFTGGVVTQKNHDAGLASSASSLTSGRARAGAGAGGFGAGGFGGGSGAGGAAGGAGASAGGAAAGGLGQGSGSGAAAGAAASEIPVVVGTVSSIGAGTLKVKNFADAVVTVLVPATAIVTTPGLGGLKVGAPVSVVGTKAADGTVTATAVTSRPAAG